MKLEFKLGGETAALKALKRTRPAKVTLGADGPLLTDAAGLAALRAAADLCIERGAELAIEGAAPCFLPGYARYLAAGKGALPCPRRGGCFLAAACRGIPARHAAIAAAFRPPARGFTDLEKCMLAILARGRSLTTAQVLKAARTIKICASCSSEGEVFRAAERLIRFGLVGKEYKGGVYLWTKTPGS